MTPIGRVSPTSALEGAAPGVAGGQVPPSPFALWFDEVLPPVAPGAEVADGSLEPPEEPARDLDAADVDPALIEGLWTPLVPIPPAPVAVEATPGEPARPAGAGGEKPEREPVAADAVAPEVDAIDEVAPRAEVKGERDATADVPASTVTADSPGGAVDADAPPRGDTDPVAPREHGSERREHSTGGQSHEAPLPELPAARVEVADAAPDADVTRVEAPEHVPDPVVDEIRVRVDDDLSVQVGLRDRDVDVTLHGSVRSVEPLKDLGAELHRELTQSGYALNRFSAHTGGSGGNPGRPHAERRDPPAHTDERAPAAEPARIRRGLLDRVA